MTQMYTDNLNAVTEKIIGCVFAVHNVLGNGFLEKVYERALCIELENAGLFVESQQSINVFYDKQLVGEFFADILVEGKIILELKSTKSLTDAHAAQCINYLKATGLPLCLLVNFGASRAEVKRFANTRFSSAPICVICG